MPTLLVLRHAKSDWSESDADDFDRPLAPRGRAAAPRIGEHLAAHAPTPDLVLCSAATRTRETWQLVAEALGADVPLEVTQALYLAGARQIRDLVRRLDPAVGTALVIGHNPGLQRFVRRLTEGGEGAAMLGDKYPTAAYAVIELAEPWAELAWGTGRLTAFVRPKDLG